MNGPMEKSDHHSNGSDAAEPDGGLIGQMVWWCHTVTRYPDAAEPDGGLGGQMVWWCHTVTGYKVSRLPGLRTVAWSGWGSLGQ